MCLVMRDVTVCCLFTYMSHFCVVTAKASQYVSLTLSDAKVWHLAH
jgi:hypothetical protein